MGGSAHHHDIVNDDSGLYAYVAMLLLDQGYGRELRRCENCRNPFLVRPTAGRGRPQKRFCSKGCATDTHDSKSGERRRRARAIGLLERKYGRAKSRDAVRRAFDLHPEVNVKALAAQAKALLSQGARKHK